MHKALKACIDNRKPLDREIAGSVANAMKVWAVDKGATHFAHWFQPLSGRAAEKHDSFLEPRDSGAIDKFSGDELAQMELDTASLPLGGGRSTFEARGYTAWDSSSPVFIFETTYGKTLCIPTILVSFDGSALDHKTPLLKSLAAINQAAVDICHFFDKDITRVYPTLGAEQEFFLVDRSWFNLRPDLLLAGRTILGKHPSHGMQIDPRYFGAIPERVFAFLNDLEVSCHKLGIPLKTRHNESSPGQFECAPIFESMNVAVDHSLMLMDQIERIAKDHHLVALLNEKPFAGLNGSGKHNSWSLMTDTGRNLLSPGANPTDNLMFLVFFTAVIKGIHGHADLLRASISTYGNDFRLGQHEAPSKIFSVFVGRRLNKVLNDIQNPPRKRKHEPENVLLRLGISEIPELLIDNTDKNRTAPFAFTGDKFEFRMVGAAANSSHPMMILNVIVADQLRDFKEKVEGKMRRGRNRNAAILDIIKEYIEESQNIRFEGDSYSQSWLTEAKKRNLSMVENAPAALDAYVAKEAIKLFERNEIFREEELQVRYEALLADYLHKARTEVELMEELVLTQILPAAVKYQSEMLNNLSVRQQLNLDTKVSGGQDDLVEEIGEKIQFLVRNVEKLKGAQRRIERRGYHREIAGGYTEQVIPLLDEIRSSVDELETHIPDQNWTLPKYREMLFIL
ncbi:MAG: glutamine synthetase III [Bacteroidota bacterium]